MEPKECCVEHLREFVLEAFERVPADGKKIFRCLYVAKKSLCLDEISVKAGIRRSGMDTQMARLEVLGFINYVPIGRSKQYRVTDFGKQVAVNVFSEEGGEENVC